jgi:uncharacterized protein (TIGR02757 family)
MNQSELKEFLDFKVEKFNSPRFIESDPIQIPHQYRNKEDIEIIAFLVATIAWGNRKMIIRNGEKLMNIMGESPYDFIMTANKDIIEDIDFVHRTFNSIDLQNFIYSLREIYNRRNGLEGVFKEVESSSMKEKIIHFNSVFTSSFSNPRSNKHVANPLKGSAAKRINMFLRWMCRKDDCGVDFGIWNAIDMSDLHIPLDVHSGNMARKFHLVKRKQNDWKAVEELQNAVIKLDPIDPSKYDFALFGLGVFEEF